MEESYETFEEELGPPRAEPPPQKPFRQTQRPEMHIKRKVSEEMPPMAQQTKAAARTLPREPSLPRQTSLRKALSIQNLSQIDRPWENVTLNRCLFVAITILVLTSGFQRLNETLRGQVTAELEEEEEVGLRVRRSETLRQRGHPPEPETSLWEVIFWWLPDLDDEEDEDDGDDVEDKGVKPRRGATARGSRGIRNKPIPDKKLMKRQEGKLKDRRAKRDSGDVPTDRRGKREEEEPEEAGNGDDIREEPAPKKNKRLDEQKEKKKTRKG
ncbi:uncharacterized protein LOC142885064 [Nelusetta ayraudi]|uniref:uncharacterized protein LOC142885064 n=1 Tax=Nelusetta ayraudi TaxID=303726 RepID=UPI003F6F3F0F